jgi:threonine/homoserine/homoserine lactone efflux protein
VLLAGPVEHPRQPIQVTEAAVDWTAVIHDLAAFLGIAVLVIVMPGQDTALTVRNTLAGGRSTGLATAAGVTAGQAVWTVASAAGVAALLAASEPVFTAVRLAGAAYLVLIGLQALRAAFARLPAGRAAAAAPRQRLAPRAGVRQGVLSNLGNPKMAVFFTSLLPQFAGDGGASFAGLLALGLLFNVLTLVWLAGYAVAIARADAALQRPAIRRAIDAMTGAVLVAFGVRLATATKV